MIFKAPRLSQICKSKSFNPKSPCSRPGHYRNIRSALPLSHSIAQKMLHQLPAFLPRICLIDQPIRTVECYSVSAFLLSSLPPTRAVPVWSPSGMPNCHRNLLNLHWFPSGLISQNDSRRKRSVFQPPTSRQQSKVKSQNTSLSSWSAQEIGMII